MIERRYRMNRQFTTSMNLSAALLYRVAGQNKDWRRKSSGCAVTHSRILRDHIPNVTGNVIRQ